MMKKVVLSLITAVTILGLGAYGASRLFSEEKILAKIGEKVITQDDLNALMKRHEPTRKGAPYTLEEKKNFLNMLIRSAVISMEAEREKLNERQDFQMKLKMARNELLFNEYVTTQIVPHISVTDEEVNDLIKKNPNLMIPQVTFTLREILVKSEKEADGIYQELKRGADFSKLAAEKSIAQTKSNGGLIGTISKAQLPPGLDAVVLGLSEGAFSKPIKMGEGFGIISLVNKKEISPERMKTLEAKLRDKLVQIEKNRKIEEATDKKVEELKKQIKVETYFDRLQ